MDKQHPTAAMVNVFQKETKTKLVAWLLGWILPFGVLWGGDWTMRFLHFGWHREVIASRVEKAELKEVSTVNAATDAEQTTGACVDGIIEIWGGNRRGGLTDFLPGALLRRPYEEWHETQYVRWDSEGYAMEPGSVGQRCSATVLGDSFLLTGNGHLFAWELEEVSGLGVKNRGRSAAGPFSELKKYIENVPREQWSPVVVWEIAGREMGASLFLRQPYPIWFQARENPRKADAPRAAARGRVHWEALEPKTLDRKLPNTSAMAYFSRKLWNWCRLVAFGEWPPEILAVSGGRFGPTLFYGENLKILPQLTVEVQGEGVLSVIEGIAKEFRKRGVELVVLLVPEKEQVWTEDLPENLREGIEASADLLRWLEREGRKRGIRVVNPLEKFRQMTRDGVALYWRGDTHWNGEGMRKAAELTAAELKTIPGWEAHTE